MLALLLDENLPRTVAASLATAGFDVITVAELRARGSPDAEVLRLAVESGRVLVTRDLDFSDILRFPLGTHRGIVVLRLPNNASVEQIADSLRSRLAPLNSAEVVGNLFIITSNLMRIRMQPQQDG